MRGACLIFFSCVSIFSLNQFNDDFVEFVLNTIEDPPDTDVDDQVSDTLIGMLLSFNQHFKGFFYFNPLFFILFHYSFINLNNSFGLWIGWLIKLSIWG